MAENQKTYVCTLCLGTGKIEMSDHDGTDVSCECPCPTCVAKGWPPNVIANRGEGPIIQVNAPVEPKESR